MVTEKQYDAAIVGGGLAGLACAIELSRLGHSVVLFEKEQYPFHKVCGEYVSMESWKYLEQLGIPLKEMQLPIIDQLLLTAPNGKSLSARLPLGGFGISRFALDHHLVNIAKEQGVLVYEETKVEDVFFDKEFTIQYRRKDSESESCEARVCYGAFGKRSNLDVKWKRSFLEKQDKKLDNYVAVKYHVQTEWPENVIGLHNFKNGYCGISRIEEEKYCLCYLTKADALRNCGGDIKRLEREVLSKNKYLKEIFNNSAVLEEFPITISQVNFQKKTLVENGIMMLGDAAGMITPLCGNGMSIALHTGKIGAALGKQFLKGEISREQMEQQYEAQWKKQFGRRLQRGRLLQRFFGSDRWSNGFVSLFRALPLLAKPVIRMTHGEPF